MLGKWWATWLRLFLYQSSWKCHFLRLAFRKSYNKTLTPTNILLGFQWSGQRQSGGIFDYCQMLRRVRRSITIPLDNLMRWRSLVGAHAELIKINEKLAESAMDVCGLPVT
jgi:hypothetical protein